MNNNETIPKLTLKKLNPEPWWLKELGQITVGILLLHHFLAIKEVGQFEGADGKLSNIR